MTTLKTNKVAGLNGTNAITGSLFFNGGDSLGIPSIALGSGDWTIEFWFYMTKTSSTVQYLYDGSGTGSVSSAYPLIQILTSEALLFYTAGTNAIVTSTKIQVGSWNHFALVKNSGTTTLYLNGVSEGTYSDNNTYLAPSNGVGRIGANDDGDELYFYGYLSNYRICTHAVYTANFFTPPTQKLELHNESVLLCCQDSDDPTQEATGKTITGFGRYFAATGEKFANTGFTADSDWQKGSGWTIANGLATHAQGSAGDLYQAVSGLVAGEIYKLSVDVISTDNDVAYFYIDGYPGSNYPPLTGSDSPVGNHFIYFAAPAATVNIGFRGSSLFAGTITNLRLSSYVYPKAPKVLPPYGIDDGTVLDGGVGYDSLNYLTLPKGTTTQSNRGRGVFVANAVSPTMSNAISYIDIQSSGNTVDFGDLTVTLRYGAGGSSATRGLSGGGVTPSWPANNVIDYYTLATTANAQEFGDMIKSGSYGHACLTNSTRLLWCGGYSVPDSNNTNTVSYSTIASLGDATDFGDLSDGSSYLRRYLGGGIQSPTRGILMGGYSGSSYKNTIVYISITTLGNSANFGDLSYTAAGAPGASSSTRGVIFPGYNGSNYNTNSIEYVTIASTGNTVDFGDTAHSGGYGQAVSNSSRAVMSHGLTPSSGTNYMEFVKIATTGNASDFGDMEVASGDSGNNNNCSDSHGGLSQ